MLKKNLRRADRKGGKEESRYDGPYVIRKKARASGTWLLYDPAKKMDLKTSVNGCNLKKYKERCVLTFDINIYKCL